MKRKRNIDQGKWSSVVYLVGIWLLITGVQIQAAVFGDYNYNLLEPDEEVDQEWEDFKVAQHKKEKAFVKTLLPHEVPISIVAYLAAEGSLYVKNKEFHKAAYCYERVLLKLTKYEKKRKKSCCQWAFPASEKEKIKYLTKIAGVHIKMADYKRAMLCYKEINKIREKEEKGVYTLRINACCCYFISTILMVPIAGLSLYYIG